MTRRRWAAVLLTAGMVLVSGCSDEDEGGATDVVGEEPSTTEGSTTTAEATTTTTEATTPAEGGSGDFCENVLAYDDLLYAEGEHEGREVEDPSAEELEAYVGEIVAATRAMADTAPEVPTEAGATDDEDLVSVRAADLAEAWAAVFDIAEENDFDTDATTQAWDESGLIEGDVGAAGFELDRYVEDECGADLAR